MMQRFQGKRIVLVLNKVDLVPPDVTQRWLAYLRQYFPTLPFKASTQTQKEIGRSATHKTGALSSYGAEAYGGEQLLQVRMEACEGTRREWQFDALPHPPFDV